MGAAQGPLDTRDAGIPRHVGLILDGNRRWAVENNLPKLEGHKRGYENLKTITEAAFNAGIEYVSAYIFSTENWNRSEKEVGYLMRLLVGGFHDEIDELIEANIKVVFLGSRARLSKQVVRAVEETERKSADKTGGTLALCFNYGGRLELVDAVKQIVDAGVDADRIDEDMIQRNLYQGVDVPDVDFMIRTSGEQRISNYMLWRMAYAELYFTDTYWPDFTPEDLQLALDDYAQRQRRRGR